MKPEELVGKYTLQKVDNDILWVGYNTRVVCYVGGTPVMHGVYWHYYYSGIRGLNWDLYNIDKYEHYDTKEDLLRAYPNSKVILWYLTGDHDET